MRVLCIATHPDDETLGVGGALLRHRAAGDEIHWMIITSSSAADFGEEFAAARPAVIAAVAEAYQFSTTVELGFAAARLSETPERDLIGRIDEAVRTVSPDVIYLNHGGDIHSDHSIAFNATMSAAKPFRAGKSVRRILTYETPSETEQAPPLPGRSFLPNVFIDISAHLIGKLEIFDLYETEQQARPLPRERSAITALARWRGATIGTESAEAFVLMREIL